MSGKDESWKGIAYASATSAKEVHNVLQPYSASVYQCHAAVTHSLSLLQAPVPQLKFYK